jgi:hypothetical protein
MSLAPSSLSRFAPRVWAAFVAEQDFDSWNPDICWQAIPT